MNDLSWIARREISTRLVPFISSARRFTVFASLTLLFMILATGTDVVAQTTQPASGEWIPPSQRKPLPSTQPTEPAKLTPTAEAVGKCISYRMTRQQNGKNTYAFYFKNVTSFDISSLVLVSLSEPLSGTDTGLPASARPPLILSMPTTGSDLGQSINVIENKKSGTPILYLVVAGPLLDQPLWIRVGPDVTPRDGFVDPATKLLAMADQVAAAGNKEAAKERYIRILTEYPEFPSSKIAQTRLGWSDHQTAQFFPKVNDIALANSALAIAEENERRRAAIDLAMQKERDAAAAEQRRLREQQANRDRANAEAELQAEMELRRKSSRELVINAAELCDAISNDRDTVMNFSARLDQAFRDEAYEKATLLAKQRDEASTRLRTSEPKLNRIIKVLSETPEAQLRPILDSISMDVTLPARITLQVDAIREAMKEFWFAANKAR